MQSRETVSYPNLVSLVDATERHRAFRVLGSKFDEVMPGPSRCCRSKCTVCVAREGGPCVVLRPSSRVVLKVGMIPWG